MPYIKLNDKRSSILAAPNSWDNTAFCCCHGGGWNLNFVDAIVSNLWKLSKWVLISNSNVWYNQQFLFWSPGKVCPFLSHLYMFSADNCNCLLVPCWKGWRYFSPTKGCHSCFMWNYIQKGTFSCPEDQTEGILWSLFINFYFSFGLLYSY